MSISAAGRQRLLATTLVVLSAAAGALFLALCSQRLCYPFELEWMEGAMVDHTARVRSGLGIYVPPSADHVPFLYTPLLYYGGALLSAVTGEGFLPLRLLSLLATLGVACLLSFWVRRETARTLPAVVAAGVFFAGYGYLRTWYDLARNDMLMLSLLLGAAVLMRFGQGWRAAVLAAVAATLAFWSKQTAILWLPALLVGCLLQDWRQGLRCGCCLAAVFGSALLGSHLATDGWFTFFVFEMPSAHGVQGDRKLGFFTEDLVPMLPMVAGGFHACWLRWRQGQRGPAWFLAAFAGGGLLTSYSSRLHVGGYDNVLLYAFAAGCVLLPLCCAVGRPGLWLLVLLQFLLLTFDVRSLWLPRPVLLAAGPAAIPAAAHRTASMELLAFLRAQDGDVWVPFHGHLAALAGKPRTAHAQAMHDLLQMARDPERTATLSPRARTAVVGFHERCTADLLRGRFGAVVLDQPLGPVFEDIFASGLARYRRRDGVLLEDGRALQPVVGMETHTPYALVPR